MPGNGEANDRPRIVERLAALVTATPWVVIVVVLALTGALAVQLRGIKLETRPHDQMPTNHPHILIDELLTERFSKGKTAVVGLDVKQGDIFTAPTLHRLQRMTEDIGHVPGVLRETIFSLASPKAKALYPEPDGLRIVPILESIPEDPAGLAALRRVVFSYPMYVGNLVTEDASGALIVADFNEESKDEDIERSLQAIAAAATDDTTEVHVSGQPAFLAAMNRNTRRALPLLLTAVVVVALVHYEAFRTGQAVVLPLVTAVLSTLWGMGLIAFLGIRFDPWTTMTAILILSVAAGHAVQILKRYYEYYHELQDNRRAVVAAVASVGPAMVTAGLVAAIGFVSLMTTHTPSVRNFGLTAAFGILSALIIELTFIPACRVLLPAPKARETDRERRHRVLDRLLEVIASRVCAAPGVVLLLAGVFVGGAALGIFRLEVNNSVENWFGSEDPFLKTHRFLNERFDGALTIQISIEGRGPDALLDPKVIRAIDELEQIVRAEPNIGATLSVADLLKTTNRAMHDDDPAEYRIPESRSLIAQYLLLYQPDDLTRILTTDYSAAVIHARSRSDKAAWAEDFFTRLRREAAERFPPEVTVGVAGGRLADQVAMNQSIVHNKLLNMAQLSAVIFVVSSLAFSSIVAGLLVLVPVLSAVLVTLGVMGWSGSWLTLGTATYTALGVSLGADFAIYFLFRLRDEVRGGAFPGAVEQTLLTSGKAIFFVSSAIAAGYAVLLMSGFPLWRDLGSYVALMMVVSALATVTLLPSLLLLRRPRFLSQEVRKGQLAELRPVAARRA